MNSNEEWSFERLEGLIASRVEESFRLDYKAAGAIDDTDKGRAEITKDVSAFANSDGGTIIYGIREYTEKEREHLPEKIDPLSRKRFSKEWLEHVIANIRPSVGGLRIIPIQCPSGDDAVVYVVEIPKSTTAHQAKDCRYYRRYNFESKAMLDYEIRDVMNRVQHPKVVAEAYFMLQDFQDGGTLHFEVHNVSEVMARHFLAVIHVPLLWRTRVLAPKEDAVLDDIDGISAYRIAFSNPLGRPLFPKSRQYNNFKFGFGTWNGQPRPTIDEIRYKVYADSSPAVEGNFTIDSIFRARV